jgi:NADH-quinone oxidoreductase subunit A
LVRVLTCHVKGCGFKSRFSRIYFIMLSQYLKIFIFFLICMLISILIFSLSYMLIKQSTDSEKLTPYECGFNPYGDARKLFDVRFYLVAILFIIFDLETAFLFPWIVTLNINFSFGFWSVCEFMIELLVGYIYIWKMGALEWE